MGLGIPRSSDCLLSCSVDNELAAVHSGGRTDKHAVRAAPGLETLPSIP